MIKQTNELRVFKLEITVQRLIVSSLTLVLKEDEKSLHDTLDSLIHESDTLDRMEHEYLLMQLAQQENKGH